MTEEHVSNEGTRCNPRRRTKSGGDKQPPFKIMKVKMIKELGRRMDEPCKKLEVSKKELESITNQRAEEYNNCN